jgi:anti-anti-sigma factor
VNGVTVIDVIGILSSSTAQKAHEELMEIASAKSPKVAMYLGQLEYVSSAGLRSILLLARRQKLSNGTFNICNLQPVVKEAIETSGVSNIIDVLDTEERAVEAQNT